MYKKVNMTENHLQVLSLFTNGFGREYYIREVQKLLNISPRTAQLILEDLERKAVLESKTRGKIKVYKTRKNSAAEDYLILVEQYKKIAFLQKKLIVKEIVAKIIPLIKGIGLIFGSYARGSEKKGSDLDLLVIGSYDRSKTKEIEQVYGIDINIKKYSLKEFKKGLQTAPLVKEVLSNHVVILNAGRFIRMILKNG